MNGRKKICLKVAGLGCIVSIIVFYPELAFSQNNQDLRKEIEVLKQRITHLEEKLAVQEKISKQEAGNTENSDKIQEALSGISIQAGATFIIQGVHNANGDNLSANGEDVTDGSYSADITLEKKLGDYDKAFIHLETGSGAGVEDELAVFSNVNQDANDSDDQISVTEIWVEHYFSNAPLILTFGKFDPAGYIDTNEYANDECTQFLGHIFKKSPAIEFPDNSMGLRLNLKPAGFADVDFVVMDADSDWEDIFDDVFIAAQINFKPAIVSRTGNYRLLGWINNRDHTKWLDIAKNEERNYGFGISCDQKLTDNIGLFLRYAWQNPEVYLNGEDFSLEQSWSAGLQLSGGLWRRNDDVFGLAFGQVFPSDDYKNAQDVKAESEEHLEVYYNFKINDHLTVSPDVQVIWDSYGCDAVNGDRTIVVGGLRTQVDF